MNRMFLVAALFFAHGGSSVFGQSPPENPVPTGTTRVAVLNLGVVFQKYDRATALKKEVEDSLANVKVEAKTLTQNLTAWTANLQKLDLVDPQRKQLEEKIIQARRQLEDMQRMVSFELGKIQQTHLVTLWKDVQHAVKDYSAQHGIELVIAYGDPADKELLATFPSITRKMQSADAGGSMPFFVSPRADISHAVVDLLNKQFRDKNKVKADPTEGIE